LPELIQMDTGVTFQETARVSDEQYRVFEFSRHGKVRFKSPVNKDPFYMAVSLKPSLYLDSDSNLELNLAGARIGFATQIQQNDVETRSVHLQVMNKRGEMENSRSSFLLDPNLEFPGWIEFMLRIDPANATYDLYFQNFLFLANLPLSPEREQVSITSRGLKAAYLRYLKVEENPWFADADLDGIPDDFERLLGSGITQLGRYSIVNEDGDDLLAAFMSTAGNYGGDQNGN